MRFLREYGRVFIFKRVKVLIAVSRKQQPATADCGRKRAKKQSFREICNNEKTIAVLKTRLQTDSVANFALSEAK